MKGATSCLHCGRLTRDVLRRGLCNRCYLKRAIRQKYPVNHKPRHAPHKTIRPASFATDAPPGSIAKMAVMRRRLESGESLHHAEDATEVVQELIDPFAGTRYTGGDVPEFEEVAC